jgi:transposase
MEALAYQAMEAAISAPEGLLGPCPACGHLSRQFEAFWKASYYQAQHQRAVAREAALAQENAELKALLRLREQQLFGRKAEASKGVALHAASAQRAQRQRGRQPGQPPPQRRDHSHLPARDETRELSAEARSCEQCGLPFTEFPGTEDSTILEVEVRAHRRRIHRKRYRPTCSCVCNPGVITAPPAPRVIPKCGLGVSIWVEALLDKYLFGRPTHRLLEDWRTLGLDLPVGTISDGLRRMVALFEPLYEALIAHSKQQRQWHADETRWQVFVTQEGKVGYRWYLWVFHAADAVVFVLSPSRAHTVPEEHFGEDAEGVVIVDRYRAYQAMTPVRNGRLVLAFCWAHVRRDFLRVAQTWTTEEAWAVAWIERIARLYARNDERLEVRHQPTLFAQRDAALRNQIADMAQQRDAELGDARLHPARRKTLESLRHHWHGLMVFVDHPDVPMDNNTAERAQRGPVVGRKNFYGSGSRWSGRLAAMLFSLFQTLCLGHLNPRAWLTAYLEACASAGGTVPPQPDRFLPWNLTADKRQAWCFHHGSPTSPDTS